LEVLKGAVKQIVETGLDLRGTPFMLRYSDTTIFDKKGIEIQTRSGWSDGQHFVSKINFKYIDDGKELELLYQDGRGKAVYKHDINGYVSEISYYNQTDLYEKKLLSYNKLGQIMQTKTYNNLNELRNKVGYKYNNDGFLLEEDYFPLGKELNGSKILYRYMSFDKKDNWTTKIKNWKMVKDSSYYQTDTITRKITYY
jgi:hypothetical protein